MALSRKSDFSGGMTDEHINGRPNCALKMENFLIDRNKKPFVRFGSDVYLKDRMSWETAIETIRQPILDYGDVKALKDLSSGYGTYTPANDDRILVTSVASIHGDWGTITGLTSRTRIETGYTVDYVLDDLSDPYGTKTKWEKYDGTTAELIVTVEASIVGDILDSNMVFYLSASPTIDISDSYYYFNTYELLCPSSGTLDDCITAWNNSTFATSDPEAEFTVTKGPVVLSEAMNTYDLGSTFEDKKFTRTAGSAGIDPVEGMKILVKSASGVHGDYGTITGLGDGDIIEYSGGSWSVIFDISEEGYDEYDWPIVECGEDEYGYAYSTWTEITTDALEPVAAGDIIEYDGTDWAVVVDASELDTDYYYKITDEETTTEYFYVDDVWSVIGSVSETISITIDIDENVVDLGLIAIGESVVISGSSLTVLNATHTITDYSTNFGWITFEIDFFDSSVEDTGSPIVTFFKDKAQLAYGAGRIDRIKYFQGELLRFQKNSVFNDECEEIVGTNSLFGRLGELDNHISMIEWKNHLYCANDRIKTPRKIFKDADGEFQVHTAGLPKIVNTPSISGTSGSKNYIYMLCHTNYYTVDGVTHVEYGPTKWVSANNISNPDTNPITLSNIDEIQNGTTENYPSDVRTAVYRTEDNGTIGYFAGYVTDGEFVDTVADGTIINNAEIYTTGGVVDNDPLPPCKYIAQTDQVAWLLGVEEDGEFKGYRARQCKYGNNDAAPESWYVDVSGDMTGGHGIRSMMIVFEKQRCYRFEGYVSSTGTGSTKKTLISDTIGCVSNNGIVPVEDGLIFPAVDGFYFTDGYRVKLISKHLPIRYAQITRTDAIAQKISGLRNPNDGRIYWTVQEGDETDENDTIWVLDTNMGLSERSTFTALTGAMWRPTSLEVVGKNLIRADASGVVFEHDEAYLSDKKITDTLEDILSTLQDVPVIYDYVGCSNTFGDEAIRSYFTMFHLQAKGNTNQSISVQSINDISDKPQKLKEIRYRGSYIWGDEEAVWGDEDAVWNYQGMVIGKRRFPANKLRATYKAMRLTNSNTNYLRSDDSGGCVVNSSTKIATLLYGYNITTEGGSQINTEELEDILSESTLHNWPTDYEEYRISFSIDDYEKDYQITDITDAEITFSDVNDESVTCETDWVIRRITRNERLYIDSYTIEYHKMSDSHDFFVAGGDGGNT